MVATSDLVLSAYVGQNAHLFSDILRLHVPRGSKVADVTYGKGAFWKKVDPTLYTLLASDLKAGVDCRKLPYEDGSIDAVVLDPPYMEGFFRRAVAQLAGSGSYASFRKHYSSSDTTTSGPRYHAAVLSLYVEAAIEARRVLHNHGPLIVKCQDEVSANRQHLTHIEIVNEYTKLGFHPKDLFVLVRTNRPGVSRMKRQVHARKNHSYFLVFVKADK